MQRVIKPKSQKAKRALEEREPKTIENTKEVMFIRGQKCPDTLRLLMRDLASIKKPHAQFLDQKNDIRPFEDHTKLEFFSKKFDKSLFIFGSSNKKRPNNLIMGRFYDYQLLDMVELGVTKFQSLSDFKNEKIPTGTKPCLMFSGEIFEEDSDMKRIKSLLIDMFRGPEVTNIRLAGLEHAIQFTATPDRKIYMRSYQIQMKKSSTPKVPRIELEEIGPSMDLEVRRLHLASDDLFKTACRQVKNVYKEKKVKNIEKDEFGSVYGTLHLPKQDLNNFQTRKLKGLKTSKAEKMAEKKAKAEKARQAKGSKDGAGDEDMEEAEGDEEEVVEDDAEEGDSDNMESAEDDE
eukprot:TCALIF_04015-PA protein Name:"Similar to Rpf2 Ribosome production factor 2 homolog (Mus musculus)" AED:0.04 eAED:0.04 QI:0/-1/0/1/-1/1/1/0/347